MSLRRIGPALAIAVALASACTDVKQEPPAPIVIATFSSPDVPTPNDLALAAANPSATPTPMSPAQKDLLDAFVASGGFPSDQAPTLTVPLQALAFDAATSRYAPATPPQVDVATVTPATFALYKLGGATPQLVETEPLPAALQAPGQLRVVKKADATGSRRLDPGRYVFAARGGGSGVKTTAGIPISPDLPIALTIPNRDLTVKENQPRGGLAAAQVAQLEQLRALLWNPAEWDAVTSGSAKLWVPCLPAAAGQPPPCTPNPAITPAYAAIGAFPYQETAAIATFEIAPALAGPYPLLDATSGQAPLPIDLARTGPNGAIAFNPAFGPAAAGIATLDGFSTTAMILAQTSVPVDASTVNGNDVFLYEWPQGAGAPALLPELKATLGAGGNPASARYVAEPTPIVIPSGAACPAAGGCSPAIGLQPAVNAGSGIVLPPLAENRRYAVVITDRVKDVAGRPLVKSTVARLLLDLDPSHHLAENGKSLVGGIDDASATALEAMRVDLEPVLAALPSGTTREHVVLAYTFKTQSFLQTSLQLSVAPYAIEGGAGQAIFTPTAVADVPPPGGQLPPGVAAYYDLTFKSVDAIDKATGALRPTLAADLASPATAAPLLAELHALVAVPTAASVPACPAPPFPAGARCARLVVVGHGLNGSKETLFALASSLASRGFLAAAIDFPLHGGRNWCTADADCQAGTCDKSGAFAGSAGQGDCGSNDPASATCTAARPGVCSGGAPNAAGSRFFLSANFFRMRDAFRQNLVDQAALVLALSRPPTGVPQPAANPFPAKLPAGVVVDPTEVYYEGVSLGSIAGTSVLATNPRLTRGALSVGGGTFIDIGVSSLTFQQELAPLFTALLHDVLPGGTPFSFDMVDPTKPAFSPPVAASFLKLVNVAKWIDDPGDPINYAGHVTRAPLPNLLASPAGDVLQPAKPAYGQIAQGDAVVPNVTSELLYGLMGADTTLYTGAQALHGMIGTQPVVQDQAAGFLLDPGTAPPTTQDLP